MGFRPAREIWAKAIISSERLFGACEPHKNKVAKLEKANQRSKNDTLFGFNKLDIARVRLERLGHLQKLGTRRIERINHRAHRWLVSVSTRTTSFIVRLRLLTCWLDKLVCKLGSNGTFNAIVALETIWRSFDCGLLL